MTSTSPSLTLCPSLQRISAIFPPIGASRGNSIFIDSKINNTSPALTTSPTLFSTLHTTPVTSAATLVDISASPPSQSGSSPVGRAAWLVWQQPIGVMHPVTKQRACIPRVNNFFDAKVLGSAKWRANRIQAGANLLSQRRRISAGFQFAPICHLQTALDGQRPPISRRPRIPLHKPVPVRHPSAAHPKDPTNNDLRRRHRRLIHRSNSPHPIANCSPPFCAAPNHQPRLISQRDDRQMERLTQINQPNHGLRPLDSQPTAANKWVRSHHPNRMPIQPGQGRHRRPAIAGKLEDRTSIKQSRQNRADAIRLASVARNCRQQIFVASVNRVF